MILLRGENHVWRASDVAALETKAIAEQMRKTADNQFGRGVAEFRSTLIPAAIADSETRRL